MELRKHRRFRAEFRSRFSINRVEVPGEGLMEDLSPGGCRIMSMDTVKIGDDLELHIFPGESHSELFIQKAKVCWTRGHEFGVAFIAVQPDVLKRLIQVWGALDDGIPLGG
jgi:hypothetical protein